jgi:hypothetical protein
MFDPMPSGFDPTTVDLLPLDGVTPTRTVPLPDLDYCQADDPFEPAACYLMSFTSGQRGPRGRGRSYIGPVGEGNTDNGVTTGTANAALVDAWNTFLQALFDTDDAWVLTVASYTHSDHHPAEVITFENTIATQRRRQDQLRT